ncbi:MAG: signal recognition particle-docking protein FtsY [Candidatus Hydrothermarchaeota archaeon]|nr:MAG: signal recognition particle-docking protein FtsY [Candidatus Hydrothermarchaeota archaeon]
MFESLKKKLSGFREILSKETTLTEEKLDEKLFELQILLLESDVALEVTEKILSDLKENLKGKKVEKNKIQEIIKNSIKNSLLEIFKKPEALQSLIKNKKDKPFVILFVGVNGTGKTTTIAKIAYMLKKHGISSVIAASDTFRAGAIEQLEEHANKVGVRLIKHQKGADPAAVAFDAIQHARARGIDVVLIDTAGRMETNVNLMDEMKKIARVTKPDLILFIGDALTGNAAVEQGKEFSKAVEIGGIILSKADADAKGGAAISLAYLLNKPIYFLGTGQGYEDLIEFDPEKFVEEIL